MGSMDQQVPWITNDAKTFPLISVNENFQAYNKYFKVIMMINGFEIYVMILQQNLIISFLRTNLIGQIITFRFQVFNKKHFLLLVVKKVAHEFSKYESNLAATLTCDKFWHLMSFSQQKYKKPNSKFCCPATRCCTFAVCSKIMQSTKYSEVSEGD